MTKHTGDALLRGVNFGQLQRAHAALMACDVAEAMSYYERATAADLRAVYLQRDGTWPLHPTPEQPSLNWACLYLGGYAIQRRRWESWHQLYDILRAQVGWSALPIDQRSQLEALNGWGQVTYRRTGRSLERLTRAHLAALREADISRLTRALHHMVLSQLYRQRRDLHNGLKHLDAADALLSWDDEPFYALYNLEHRGDLYYFLHLTHPGFAERAIALYTEAEAKTRQYASGIDFTAHAYNIGWVYAETRQYDAALAEFGRGLDEAGESLGEHEQGLYEYGLGYVYMMLGRDSLALDYLESALGYFCAESPTYTAAVLNLMAIICAKTDQSRALSYALDAYTQIQRTDNPVHRHHITRMLSVLYAQRRDPRCIPHLLDMFAIRLRYRMKLWPI